MWEEEEGGGGGGREISTISILVWICNFIGYLKIRVHHVNFMFTFIQFNLQTSS